jgi:hypothetical protein
MGQTVRFQDTLRRLAMIDEGFVDAPRLQLVRGPYPIADGIAACEQHRRRYQQLEVTGRPGTVADAG